MRGGLAGAVFIMCIMLNSFGLAWASGAAKIWLMLAGMARFWLRGRLFFLASGSPEADAFMFLLFQFLLLDSF